MGDHLVVKLEPRVRVAILAGLLLGVSLPVMGSPLLSPPPRHVNWTGESVGVAGPIRIVAAGDGERQVARVLRAELARLHGVEAEIGEAPMSGVTTVTLALSGSTAGERVLKESGESKRYHGSPGDERYLLESGGNGVAVVAETPRGLLYGAQTLLQLVTRADGKSVEIAGARIVDYPELGFRGIHLCIFPNTELASIRQAILLAARYKYNAVVLELWASFQSPKHPETAYRYTYTPAQIKQLVDLGRALQLEMIPMLNAWGHASGMRSRSEQHVVLDRHPQYKDLYEPDGWSFCLTNPAVYEHLFSRFTELIDLFGSPRFFHAGLDEAWGHLGLNEAAACRGSDPRQTIKDHLFKLHGFFHERNMQMIVWHDMFVEPDHPTMGAVSPANSRPPFNSHLVLEELPKDIIIDTWNYSEKDDWPVPAYFQEKGFRVLVSPWKSRSNSVLLVNTAKERKMMGMLETTWDSLQVTLPLVAASGVLAWTPGGFDLDTVPYESYLKSIRELPIEDLPELETTLDGETEARSPVAGGQMTGAQGPFSRAHSGR